MYALLIPASNTRKPKKAYIIMRTRYTTADMPEMLLRGSKTSRKYLKTNVTSLPSSEKKTIRGSGIYFLGRY